MDLTPAFDQLAPPPDFRYVGLHAGRSQRARMLAAAVGFGALGGAAFGPGALRGAVAAVAVIAAALAVEGLRTRAHRPERCPRPPSVAIVPWGILVESDEASRILRWAAVERVHLRLAFGRDGGTPTAKDSLVTVETGRERFMGRAFGAVPLERLVVHLEAYAKEASHRVALDLDGKQAVEGPDEPEFEPILLAARAWVESAGASKTLALPPAGYRRQSARAHTRRTVEVLGEVLRDRRAHRVDPRAFAAVVAVELGARELVEDLVALVQSPHPLIAAVAKVAARKLGVARSRVGALDEVAPFLLGRDLEALSAWGAC